MARTAVSEHSGNTLAFADYLRCWTDRTREYVTQSQITAREHRVQTVVQRKVALNFDDQKRHVLADGNQTLPFGYMGRQRRDLLVN